jgi:hypothetical protein
LQINVIQKTFALRQLERKEWPADTRITNPELVCGLNGSVEKKDTEQKLPESESLDIS